MRGEEMIKKKEINISSRERWWWPGQQQLIFLELEILGKNSSLNLKYSKQKWNHFLLLVARGAFINDVSGGGDGGFKILESNCWFLKIKFAILVVDVT